MSHLTGSVLQMHPTNNDHVSATANNGWRVRTAEICLRNVFVRVTATPPDLTAWHEK